MAAWKVGSTDVSTVFCLAVQLAVLTAVCWAVLRVVHWAVSMVECLVVVTAVSLAALMA